MTAWTLAAVLLPTADVDGVVLQSKGYLVPVCLTQVSPRVAGVIEWVDEKLFQEGALVKEGTPLARIDPAEFDLRLKMARAAHLAARARLRDHETDPKASAARKEAAKEEAEQAKAAMDLATLRRGWCEIRAPHTGSILSKKAERFNLVNPKALSSGISASLCEMADLTKLEVDLAIQERDIPLITFGQPCRVMPEAYAKDKRFLKTRPDGYEAVVSRIMPVADRAKGAIPVRVRIKDIPAAEAGKLLRPEMGVLVSFLKKEEL